MKLDHIAADLKLQARLTPGEAARTKLPRGLVLSFKRIDRRCTLTAARVDVHPSTDEALIIARSFAVPLGTEPVWGRVGQKTKTGTLHWHTIQWQWMEEESPSPRQAALLTTASAYP